MNPDPSKIIIDYNKCLISGYISLGSSPHLCGNLVSETVRQNNTEQNLILKNALYVQEHSILDLKIQSTRRNISSLMS